MVVLIQLLFSKAWCVFGLCCSACPVVGLFVALYPDVGADKVKVEVFLVGAGVDGEYEFLQPCEEAVACLAGWVVDEVYDGLERGQTVREDVVALPWWSVIWEVGEVGWGLGDGNHFSFGYVLDASKRVERLVERGFRCGAWYDDAGACGCRFLVVRGGVWGFVCEEAAVCVD